MIPSPPTTSNPDNPAMRGRLDSAVAQELHDIRERYERADRRMLVAGTMRDSGAKAEAEAERREAMGDRLEAGRALGELLLLLIRMAAEHCGPDLSQHLAEALRPELSPLADALARLEGRR